MNLIISGPQGSGKGTQAKLLAEKLGLVHLETGEMFRRAAEKNTAFGKRVKKWLNKGKLVPDTIVFELLSQVLTENVLSKGFILDGSPRTLAQIKWLERELSKKDSQIDKLIFLKISKEVSIKRLSSRRICPKCDRNYNLITMPPQHDELCDDCRIKLCVREDETPLAIAKRLDLYQAETAPMIRYYQKSGKVIEINGEQPVAAIQEQILQKLAFK